MTQKITLRTLQATEFRSPQNELITNAIVSASELLDRHFLKFGLAPNLRVAKNKSTVITSILSRIESEKSIHIDSPIRLSCRESRIIRGQLEVVVDPDLDGVMDGGHRCRALELASLKGMCLDNVTIQLHVFSGLEKQDLRIKAIQSNTSSSVSARSRQYFSGVYDELIERIDMSKYPACFWRDGESPDATGIFCQGLHIIMLLSWVSPDMYDRSGAGQSPHARAKNPGVKNQRNTLSMSSIVKVAHLFDDIFAIEKSVINALLLNPTFTSFVRMNPSVGRRVTFQYPSKLLDGTEIQARLPGAIAGPVIYPVRKMLTRDHQWQHPTKLWVSKWTRHAVPKYIKQLQRLGAEDIALGNLLVSTPILWRYMDTLFNKWRDDQRIADIY